MTQKYFFITTGLLAALLVSCISQYAYADSPSLFFTPDSGVLAKGVAENIQVTVLGNSESVCAVKGTIVFTDMVCRQISLAGALVPEQNPTCGDPRFLIGIPQCASSATRLFTITAVPGTYGTASLSASGVSIIGNGVRLGAGSMPTAVYQVPAPPVASPKKTAPDTSLNTTHPALSAGQETMPATPAPVSQPLPATSPRAEQGAALAYSPGLPPFLAWINDNLLWITLIALAVILGAIFSWQRRAHG